MAVTKGDKIVEQLQTTELVKPVSDRVKYERDAKMTEIEIDCRVAMQPIPGGLIVEQGVKRYRVSTSDLPIVMAMTQSPEQQQRFERATEQHERELQFLIDSDDNVAGFRKRGIDVPKDGAAPPSVEQLELMTRIKELRDTYPSSPEAQLLRLFPGVDASGLNPFASVRVIADNIVNPADAERIAMERERAAFERSLRTEEAANSAGAVAAAVSAALAPVVQLILEQMKQQSTATKKGG
jgi:hypothetical protein